MDSGKNYPSASIYKISVFTGSSVIFPFDMHAGNHIHYLQRQDIDLIKWNACITAAPNGLIYARSFYLDAMTAEQWDGLVMGDYEAVMPLPWRRKFGFYYLYQ